MAQGGGGQLAKKVGTKSVVKPPELHMVSPGLLMMLLQFLLSSFLVKVGVFFHFFFLFFQKW